jgi:predicted ATPase
MRPASRADPLDLRRMDSRLPFKYQAPSPGTGTGVAGESPPVWHLRLLGALQARCGSNDITHFPTRAVAALLARLALEPDRAHPRETLVELLWPGVAPEAGRNRLRQTLSTLKSLLLAAGGVDVIAADRFSIRAVSGALASDVGHFDRLLRSGDFAGARAAYGGEFMPGHYEDWVIEERQRLASLFERLDQTLLSAALQGAVATPQAQAAATARPLHPASRGLGPGLAVPAVDPLASGLPHYWTRSIGAELAASRLSVLVRAQRLVTVHGPGGSGKTRLAVDVARALRDDPTLELQELSAAPRFDRVRFVPLLDCVDAAQTLDALCAALQLEATPGQAPARISAALSGGRTLLVLDNLEQLNASAGQAIAGLLAASGGVHVLATSRQLLDLDGEQAFELDGLALPPAQVALAEASINPAVMLFVDRARAARADFLWDAEQLRAVVDLVRLLGGMPLAIELAASRVRSLAPAELLQRLIQDAGTPMLDLLARSEQRTTAGSRHASMRHVVGWSWRQLNPAQTALMRAMTVLGAPAQRATVAALAGVSDAQAQQLLASLCDASLIRRTSDAQGATRYAQQQPVREYAAQACTADENQLARQRLRHWLMAQVARARPGGQSALAAALAPEMSHLHAALVSAPADGQGADAWHLAVALRSYWEADDLPTSSLLALQQCLPELKAAADRSDAHELLAMGFASAGQLAQAQVHAEAAIDQARQAGDQRRIAQALTRWVWTQYCGGQFDTAALLRTLEEAAALAQFSADVTAQATVLRVQAGLVSNLQLDYAASERLSAQSQHLWEQAGNPVMARLCLLARATMWAWQHHEDLALPVFAQCEVAAQVDGDWMGVLTAARQTGRVCVRLRRWPQAVEALRRAVHVGWQRRYGRGLANALLNLPEALLMNGQPEAAARLHGFALAHWAQRFGTINPIETAEQRRARRLLRLHLGAQQADALRLQGAGLGLATAVDLALAQEALK